MGHTKLAILVLLFLSFFAISCKSTPFGRKGGNKNEGGSSSMQVGASKTKTYDAAGNLIEEKSEILVDGRLKQPENPEQPTDMSFDFENWFFKQQLPRADTLPVDPSNLPKIDHLGQAFGQLVLVGGLLLVAGIIMCVMSFKFGTWALMAGFGASAGGVVLMGISAAISASQQQLGILLISAVVAILVGSIVMFFHWKKDKKALKQTTEGLNEIKETDPDAWQKVGSKLKEAQDADVKKYLKKTHLNND
jgi:flagellar basal body-associated protein FliL